MPETKSNGEPLGRGGEPEGKQPARPKEKPYAISKEAVWKAYQEVKANDGAAGVDDESIAAFEADLKDNLYKVWNRMSSGSYFPPPVRGAEIATRDGGERTLGIPTVADRVAQGVVKAYLEPLVEPIFLPDSYGYRPGKSALDAVKVARERCWDYDWVVDLDVKAFFDNLDHELMLKAVQHHQPPAWVVLYVTRWLTAPAQHADGRLEARTKGTPQGGVASPLLANLFLHYAFDVWISKELPDVRFERYADDIIIHVATLARAEETMNATRTLLAECKLD